MPIHWHYQTLGVCMPGELIRMDSWGLETRLTWSHPQRLDWIREGTYVSTVWVQCDPFVVSGFLRLCDFCKWNQLVEGCEYLDLLASI